MAVSSAASLVDALRQYRLVDPAHLEDVKSLQTRLPDPKALAGELIRHGWLTPYQANQLLQGRGQELLLGSYVLLERLGEGGMGQVFKAKNWKLGRTVALKLIRKERLDNPDAIRRFEREVRSAAALDHPNIVRALDADQIGGTHLLVMDYVEGTDLAKLVKKNGPLPVLQVCEYIRQAALGLQHAFERGLVHRDIKPANLLLTADGKTVKVLDMGLARLDQPTGDDDKSSTMTQEGMVMGTPDYIAPEQALESHTVDIRGDLYSLGCTFYFLLTGKVPFPGGTLLQKLNKHQNQEAPAVQSMRPAVSPAVGAVVRKMMAKKPEDRFQAPGDLAAALAAPLSGSNGAFPGEDRTIAEGAQVVPAPSGDSLDSALDYMAQRGDTEAVNSPHRLVRKAEERRLLLYLVAGGSFVLVGLAVVLFVALKEPARKKPPGNEEAPPVAVSTPAKAKVDEAWLQKVAAMPPEKQVEAVAAKLKELNPGFDGKVTDKIEGGKVTALQFITDKVTDISPVVALTGLQSLGCGGTEGRGQLADLSPLKEMKLTTLDCAHAQLSDLSPLKDMRLTTLNCSKTKVSDLTPLKAMKLTALSCVATPVADLSPLKDMKLTSLHCYSTPVSDLSPLKDMRLVGLDCGATKVSDLSPLKDMKLTLLHFLNTPVSDLSPLKDMKLTNLNFGYTNVSDLSPLKDMKLTYLNCRYTKVTDLSLLKRMPLIELNCDFRPERDAEIVRSIKTLEKINLKPAQEFWKEVDEKQAAFEAWCKQVAAMPAEKQVEAVAAMLRELNLGFNGKETHKIEGGMVTELQFSTDKVTDISPVRALIGLQTLNCSGTHTDWQPKGLLADLSPLKDMKLTKLDCRYTKVSDLSPLKDMKLTSLECSLTKVADLSPLKDMKLTFLNCNGTKASDLSPLKNMKLTRLECIGTKVSDLSPLKDMKLTWLNCQSTPVSDLSPLKDMKLTFLGLSYTPVSDLSPLKGMPLTALDCHDTKVADLSPLKGMKLTELYCYGTQASDLSPLKGMPLKELQCDFKPERDAEILRSIKTLETINGKPAAEFWKEVDEKKLEKKP